MCCKLLTVNHLQCIGVKRVVFCCCLNQLIGTDIAERPIQDEDSTQKKMLKKFVKKLSYVYMIKVNKPAQTDPYVKIGCTNNPKERMYNLQQGNAYDLNFALVIKVPDEKKFIAEKKAQQFFVDRNLRTKPFLKGGSEWFDTSTIGIKKAREIIEENLRKESLYKGDETRKFQK